MIGCSAGGVRALGILLGGLSPTLVVPVIVVCHVGGEDVEMLCAVLSLQSKLPVQEAHERHSPCPGRVYIAPAGYHLLIERQGEFSLSVDQRVCYSRPAIDVLFTTAAEHYQQHLIGVVLTGANDDGALGLKAIRDCKGIGIIQSPADAEASAMPEAAIRIAGADHVLALNDIAPLINSLCLP